MSTSYKIVVIVLLSLLSFSNSKTNVFEIIVSHIKTLTNSKNNRISKWDIFTFLLIPFILSTILVMFGFSIEPHIDSFLTVFSIFGALLFNFLVLIVPLINVKVENINQERIDYSAYKKCINDTYSNVCFAILICIFIVVVLLATMYSVDMSNVLQILSVLALWLIIVFFLDFLMILKRIHVIFSVEKDENMI